MITGPVEIHQLTAFFASTATVIVRSDLSLAALLGFEVYELLHVDTGIAQ